MHLAIASDHAGFRLKDFLIPALRSEGHWVLDFGTLDEGPCDYPDFVIPAARAVASGRCERGIVIGGSGNGEAMAANRVVGVRCAVCMTEEMARLSRQHNDANMLALGGRLVTPSLALEIAKVWLDTQFEGGRHLSRIAKLDQFGS